MPWWEPTDSIRQLYRLALQQFSMVQTINQKVDHLVTSAGVTQAAIDALTAQVSAADDKIQAAVTELLAEIDTLQANGVDVSGLTAAVDKLTADAASDTPVVAPVVAPVEPPVDPTP